MNKKSRNATKWKQLICNVSIDTVTGKWSLHELLWSIWSACNNRNYINGSQNFIYAWSPVTLLFQTTCLEISNNSTLPDSYLEMGLSHLHSPEAVIMFSRFCRGQPVFMSFYVLSCVACVKIFTSPPSSDGRRAAVLPNLCFMWTPWKWSRCSL